MVTSENNLPFLQRARRVEKTSEETKEKPLFLQRSKKVESLPSEEGYKTDEEIQRDIDRNQARMFSRGIETVLGAPGDILSFVRGLFGGEQDLLPTSQSLRELSEKATFGYTKPESETEEKADEFISDVASMAIPGSGHYSLARNVGIPIVGLLAKEGIKYAKGDEKDQAYGKVGTMIALDLLSRKSGNLKSHIGSLFQKAEESIPKGVSIQAKGLQNALNSLEKELQKGGKRPTTTKSLEKISEIRNEIKNGKIDAKSLAAYRPSINEAIEELGGFNIDIPRKLKPKAIFNLNQVKKEVIKTLDQYGENFNPEFLKYNRSANEAFAAYQNSNKIANFIRDKVGYSPKSKAVQALFSYAPGVAATSLLKSSPQAAAGIAIGIGAYQGFKVLHRVINSPTARRYYQNILKESIGGNAPEVAKNLKALDIMLKDDLQQQEKK